MRLLVLPISRAFVIRVLDMSEFADALANPSWASCLIEGTEMPAYEGLPPPPMSMCQRVDRSKPVPLTPMDLVTYAKSVRDTLREGGRVAVAGCTVTVKTDTETQSQLSAYEAQGKEDDKLTITLTSSLGDMVLNYTQVKACANTVTRFRDALHARYSAAKADLNSANPTLRSSLDIDAFFASRPVTW